MSSQTRAEAIPADPTRALRAITKSWEAFVGRSNIPGTLPRPVIAQRWERCRELGIDPFMERAPTVLQAEEITAILAREDLGRAGKQVGSSAYTPQPEICERLRTRCGRRPVIDRPIMY